MNIDMMRLVLPSLGEQVNERNIRYSIVQKSARKIEYLGRLTTHSKYTSLY